MPRLRDHNTEKINLRRDLCAVINTDTATIVRAMFALGYKCERKRFDRFQGFPDDVPNRQKEPLVVKKGHRFPFRNYTCATPVPFWEFTRKESTFCIREKDITAMEVAGILLADEHPKANWLASQIETNALELIKTALTGFFDERGEVA